MRCTLLQSVNPGPKVCDAGPASSPLGQGITSALQYVIVPPGFNSTVPSGYDYTAHLDTPLV